MESADRLGGDTESVLDAQAARELAGYLLGAVSGMPREACRRAVEHPEVLAGALQAEGVMLGDTPSDFDARFLAVKGCMIRFRDDIQSHPTARNYGVGRT